MMKPIILLTILCHVFMLPDAFAKTAQAVPDDQRVTYRSLHEDPRFQKAIQFDEIDYPRLHQAIFYATNWVRARHGLAPLAHHPLLEKAARRYAKRMVKRNFMAHEDPYAAESLRTPEQRLRAAGVVNPMPAENLASHFGIQYQAGEQVYRLPGRKGRFSRTPKGQPIPNHTYRSFAESVVDAWMSSPGHRANVLAEQALQLGCGADFFWENNSFPKFKVVQLYQLYELAKP
jgi:uncharacterized protein YkwD